MKERSKRWDYLINEKEKNKNAMYLYTEEELDKILNLTIGSVSPLGLVNDRNHLVTLLIDKELENKKVLVHPNINTKTISLKLSDLIELIEYINHPYSFIRI